MKRMSDLYCRELLQATDIVEHLPDFVDHCINTGVKSVIELGVRTGVSTVAWLYALELTGGHLWSVDVSPKPEHLDHAQWTFLDGDDLSPEIVSALPAEVDVVFIDTTHAHDQTLSELELYVPKVRPGGVVFLHDTEVETPEGIVDDPPFPVKAAVQTFCDREGLFWSNVAKNNGLATIRIPEDS